MKNSTFKSGKNNKQRGQSLVEVALFFPIFIIMLAGLVEVSNLLVTQNRVSSATRAAARFAADGGENAGMTTVLLNTVTQTLQHDEELWDVWAVRGTVTTNGSDIVPFEFEHIYGQASTQQFNTISPTLVKQEILDELLRDEFGNQDPAIVDGLRFAGTYAIHDVDSILGLNAMPGLVGLTSVKELTVMRITGLNLVSTNGCTGFPIAVHEGVRSASYPGQGGTPFPAASQFDAPTNLPPDYYNYYFNHTPDTPLLQATEGDVFKIQNGFGSGNFGWLKWNQYVNSSEVTLDGSLSWPGNSDDYTTNAPGQTPPGFPHGVYGFIEAGDPSDVDMNVNDWVAAGVGSVNSNGVRQTLDSHVANERTLRLIVWDTFDGTGTNGRYHISRFGIFRLLGYNLDQGQGDSWILAEFIRWDESCGQE